MPSSGIGKTILHVVAPDTPQALVQEADRLEQRAAQLQCEAVFLRGQATRIAAEQGGQLVLPLDH